jgi:hypothetical protein
MEQENQADCESVIGGIDTRKPPCYVFARIVRQVSQAGCLPVEPDRYRIRARNGS